MLIVATIACVLVGLTGLAFKQLTRNRDDLNISVVEFLVVWALACLVFAPGVVFVGNKISVAKTLTYEEFYNGVETTAAVEPETCRKGSSGQNRSAGESNCNYTWDCDTYSFEETYYVTEFYTDSEGKQQSRQKPAKRRVWADIECPYAKGEYRYRIDDSLGGEYRFPTTYVAEDPVPASSRPVPADLPRGAPAEWLVAKQRLDAGDPRAVTRMFDYDNFILAAKEDLLLPYSEDVDRYLEQDILPEHTAGIMDEPLSGLNESQARKVSFVGVSVDDEPAWQESLMGLNAALGSSLQGDMHVVFIDSAIVDSPDTYLNALKAYWVGDTFKKRAIAKNAIIVAVGVRNNVVDWARATTGMPFGNDVMLRGIVNELHGTPMDPEAIFGNPRTIITPATSEDSDDSVEVQLAESPGVLERIVLRDFPFERACMKSCDAGEVGYSHLVEKIKPSGLALSLMVFVVWLLSLPLWWAVATYSPSSRTASARTRSYNYSY